MLPYQIQHNTPVDVPGCACGRDLKIRQINLAHGSSRFRGLVRIANYIRFLAFLSIDLCDRSVAGTKFALEKAALPSFGRHSILHAL